MSILYTKITICFFRKWSSSDVSTCDRVHFVELGTIVGPGSMSGEFEPQGRGWQKEVGPQGAPYLGLQWGFLIQGAMRYILHTS